MKVTLLSRPGCHLCDDALEQLEQHSTEGVKFEIEVVNIETDDDLHRRYLELIPVILLEGEVVSELAFSSEEFDAAIARRLQGRG